MKFVFVQNSLREKHKLNLFWEQICCIAVLKSSIKKPRTPEKREEQNAKWRKKNAISY